jgi:hypothetical protein
MGTASAEDSHLRIAEIAARIWALLSIVNTYLDVPCASCSRLDRLFHPNSKKDRKSTVCDQAFRIFTRIAAAPFAVLVRVFERTCEGIFAPHSLLHVPAEKRFRFSLPFLKLCRGWPRSHFVEVGSIRRLQNPRERRAPSALPRARQKTQRRAVFRQRDSSQLCIGRYLELRTSTRSARHGAQQPKVCAQRDSSHGIP